MYKANVLLLSPSHFIGGKNITYKNVVAPEYAPLNLAYLAGILEGNSYRVRLMDANIEDDFEESVVRYIRTKNPLLVGISSTTPLFENALKLANLVKKINQETPVVFGGMHATVLPTQTIANESVDFVVVAEGEITLVELADMLHRNETAFESIDGLVFKQNGGIRTNPRRAQIKNLDLLPLPRRDLIQSNRYKYPDTLYRKTLPIITSRGCPGACTFCSTRNIFPHIRFRTADNVVDEIETLIRQYNIDEIHIWDDCFTLHKKRVFEIEKLLRERKIKIKIAFPNGFRVDTVDSELLAALKSMGVYSVSFGVESGNQKVLDKVCKGVTLAQIEGAFKLAKRFGFEVWGFFMIGLPGDDEITINDTIKFAIKLDPDVAKFSVLVPYPDTAAFTELNNQGFILEKDFLKYGYHSRPVHRLETLTPDDLIRLHSYAYRRFYLRPRKIVQHLMRLRSWERVKTNIQMGISIIRLAYRNHR